MEATERFFVKYSNTHSTETHSQLADLKFLNSYFSADNLYRIGL